LRAAPASAQRGSRSLVSGRASACPQVRPLDRIEIKCVRRHPGGSGNRRDYGHVSRRAQCSSIPVPGRSLPRSARPAPATPSVPSAADMRLSRATVEPDRDGCCVAGLPAAAAACGAARYRRPSARVRRNPDLSLQRAADSLPLRPCRPAPPGDPPARLADRLGESGDRRVVRAPAPAGSLQKSSQPHRRQR
jgi:hypothetical protein